MAAEAPQIGHGSAPALDLGGTLVFPPTALKVRALPANLPNAIHFDLSQLAVFGASLTVGDLVLPDGVSALASVRGRACVTAPRGADAAGATATAAEAPAPEA